MKEWKEILIELAKKLTPILAFAVLMVMLFAWFGKNIPPVFQALVYILAIGGMLIYTFQIVIQNKGARTNILDTEDSKQQLSAPPELAESDITTIESKKSSVNPEEALQNYIEAVIQDSSALRLVGLDPQASDPSRGRLSLNKLYISLDTTKRIFDQEGPGVKGYRQLSILEALAQSPSQQMVLLGLPGTGKSTFVRHLALQLAISCLGQGIATDNLPGWLAHSSIPVIISLGRLADFIPHDTKVGTSDLIEKYLVDQISCDPRTSAFSGGILETIRNKPITILFDGLDEVSNLELRPIIIQSIETFVIRYKKNPINRFLVTCRTYSYFYDTSWQLADWPAYEIALLDQKKISQFVRAWYDEHSHVDPGWEIKYSSKKESMLIALSPHDRRRLHDIATYPLILTLMAIIHTHYGELPDTRAQVYEKCIDLLLIRWESERTKNTKKNIIDALDVPRGRIDGALREIAYRAHDGGDDNDIIMPDLITEDLISGVLKVYLEDSRKVDIFLEYCQSGNGLLMQHGTIRLPTDQDDIPNRKIYTFPHITFQEYLAGRHLDGPGIGARVRKKLDTSDRWHEAIILLGEYLCFERQDYDRMDSILKALAPTPLPQNMKKEDWRALWVAGELMVLYRRVFPNPPEVNNHIIEGLRHLIDTHALQPKERSAAADVLDELDYLPDNLFKAVIIPSTQGPTPTEKNITSEKTLISLYPVTNYQYERFLSAFDFADEELWVDFPKFYKNSGAMQTTTGIEGLVWLQSSLKDETLSPDGQCIYPRFWDETRFGSTHRGKPVVHINWYEANAYCKWVKKHWHELAESRQNPNIQPKTIRLPTESEWILAAGGNTPPNRFPWNKLNENTVANSHDVSLLANFEELQLGSTTPVGMFPLGKSPLGVWDLAGNVWELLGSYADESRGTYMIRGGSWTNEKDNARLSNYSEIRPDSSWQDVGFRILIVGANKE